MSLPERFKKITDNSGVQAPIEYQFTGYYKGIVENRIGQLSRFFPERTNLSAVTDQQIKQDEQFLNDRPVKKFNYKMPNQVQQGKNALIT